MRKFRKKLIVIFITLAFLISGLASSSAIIIHKNNIREEKDTSLETTSIEKTVTVYRNGIDGSLKPVELEIKLEKGEDINDAIAEQCEKLIREDSEFQSLKNDSILGKLLSFVDSSGRGLLIKLKPKIYFMERWDIFPLLPPYFFSFLRKYPRIPIIYSKYLNDEDANTTITTLDGVEKIIVGPHRVLSVGFFGFKWWIGRISYLGSIFGSGFVGFSILTITTEQ